MKRTVSIFLCLILSLLITVCAAESNAGIPEQAEPSGAGSATAKVEGFGGIITVNITVENGTITELTFVGKGETDEFGGEAMTKLQALVVENNSLDVDTVAGATITSKAFLEACRLALAEIAAN